MALLFSLCLLLLFSSGFFCPAARPARAPRVFAGVVRRKLIRPVDWNSPEITEFRSQL
jgi:hypothetical protein